MRRPPKTHNRCRARGNAPDLATAHKERTLLDETTQRVDQAQAASTTTTGLQFRRRPCLPSRAVGRHPVRRGARDQPAASLTTLLLPRSATYTLPALSTATPTGVLSPVSGRSIGALDPAGNFTTSFAS